MLINDKIIQLNKQRPQYSYTKLQKCYTYIRDGVSIMEASKLAEISYDAALKIHEIIIEHFRDEFIKRNNLYIPRKQPYYKDESEMMKKPTYSVDDLKGDELEILNTLKNETKST